MEPFVSDAFGGGPGAPIDWVYDADGNFVTSNPRADELWYKYLDENDVRFTFETPIAWQQAEPLTGQVTANLSFFQHYWDTDSVSSVTLFRADLGMVTIDADAYEDVTTESAIGQSTKLSGIHRMLIQEWEYKGNTTDANGSALDSYLHYYVSDLDMSGVTITVESVAFLPTGPEIVISLIMPESWTSAERAAAGQGGEAYGIGFTVVVDGKEVQHPSFARTGYEDAENEDYRYLTVR